MFEIRRFRPEDEPQLMKAWEEAYPKLFHFKYPERWKWNILGNPFVKKDNHPLAWVVIAEGEAAAWSCAMAVPIHAAGRRVVGGHSVDTFTLERYRRYGLGKKLQELNQEAHEIFIAIDPSPANRRNKYKVGGHAGKPLDTWLRIDNSLDANVLYESFLRLVSKYLGTGGISLCSILKNLGLAQCINLLCSMGLRLRQSKARQYHAAQDLIFEAVDNFSDAADDLWKVAAERYSFAICRDRIYLNWKYSLQPNLKYRKFIAWRDDSPLGILIYRFAVSEEQRVGIISECFCVDDDPATHAALVQHALDEFNRNGVDLIKCGASTDNQRQALRDLGFALVDIDVPVFHVDPRAQIEVASILAGEWLLSLGDSDIDQIRPEHQPTFVEIVRLLRGTVPGAEHVQR